MPKLKIISRSFITPGIHQLKNKYNDMSDEHLFAMWVLYLFHFKKEITKEIAEELHRTTFRSNDFQLDGYYFDREKDSLYLYQAKYPQDSNSSASKGDYNDVKLCFNNLETHERNTGGLTPERKAAVKLFKEVKESGGKIFLRGVIGAKWKKNHVEDMGKFIKKLKRKKINIIGELYGLGDLRDIYADAESSLKDKIIDIQCHNAGQNNRIVLQRLKNAPGFGDSEVILLSAKSIALLTKEYDIDLFDQNVRSFLGGKINKEMRKSIEESHDKFWYGHNGITIVCEDYKVDDIKKVISIKYPQIVNGCQTAMTLKEIYEDWQGTSNENRDFPVLTKLIKIDGNQEEKERATMDIAKWSNSQNAIKEADLRSNDKTLKEYEIKLSELDAPWYFERKRNGFKNLSRHKKDLYKDKKHFGYRLISKDEYQQAWRAYSGTPAEAITKKKLVWEDLTTFRDVFSHDRRPIDIILVAIIQKGFRELFNFKKGGGAPCVDIQSRIKDYAQQIKSAQNLVVLHSVALFGHYVIAYYESPDKYPGIFQRV